MCMCRTDLSPVIGCAAREECSVVIYLLGFLFLSFYGSPPQLLSFCVSATVCSTCHLRADRKLYRIPDQCIQFELRLKLSWKFIVVGRESCNVITLLSLSNIGYLRWEAAGSHLLLIGAHCLSTYR